MKKLITLFVFISIHTFVYSQTQWAKEDAKWWYISESDFGFKFPYSYEFIGMEDIAGKNCYVVRQTEVPTGITFTIHVYEEDDKVYIYHPGDSIFSLRYNFNAVAGDSWIYTEGIYSQGTLYYFVDSVSTITIQGLDYQAQFMRIENPNLPFSTELETVIPGIGSLNQFRLPEPSELTVFGDIYLGCYSSLETGLLHFSSRVNCDDLAVAVKEETIEDIVTCYPNPATTHLTLELPAPLPAAATWSLHAATGQPVRQVVSAAGQTKLSIPLDGLPPGLYFWKATSQGRSVGEGKVVVLK